MHKIIGIWGLGIVGKSATRFIKHLYPKTDIQILNNQDLSPDQQAFTKKYNAKLFSKDSSVNFFESSQLIILSPGININNYPELLKYKHKFITELDLFYRQLNKAFKLKTKKPKIISVTGTLGKTSTVHIIKSILEQNKYNYFVGGNIGNCTLDLFLTDNYLDLDYILLELSSFQLEYIREFISDISIITNLYPNHLDRHKTLEQYINAKFNIINLKSSCKQTIILPIELYKYYQDLKSKKCIKNKEFIFFSHTHTESSLDIPEQLYFINKNQDIKCVKNKIVQTIIKKDEKPLVSYSNNWIAIIALIKFINIQFADNIDLYTQPAHRKEYIDTINSVIYFNDSKSTVPQATLAAIYQIEQQYPNKNIHLFLGGLSKGINRQPFIKLISDSVRYIYCFGQEAEQLDNTCRSLNKNSFKFENLNQAFMFLQTQIKSNDIVLFSPSGSSFDLFKNFEERGNYFKKLVQDLTR